MPNLFPVILAGGSGTRLWPLSRKSYPKQFANLIGNRTLFQECAMRLQSSEIVKFDQPICLTHSDFRFIVCDQLQSVGIDPGQILLEPEAKNTAPSIIAASLFAKNLNEEAILLVAPSDHVIADTKSFHKSINAALDSVIAGNLVTFGVKPTRAETGYGYLEIENQNQFRDPTPVKRFIEKPNISLARKMLSENKYFWNSGLFMFRAKDLIKQAEIFASVMVELIEKSIKEGKEDLGFFRLDQKAWSQCESISIDYAIMENTKSIMAIPLSSKWSDLGNWSSVWSEMGPDEQGVVCSGNSHSISCTNSLLRTEGEGHLVGLGLDNIIAISTSDAVLVAHKDSSQEVSKVVEALRSENVLQADNLPKDYRPWGWFETLTTSDEFQVKKILVNPGDALSLQSHKYRSEHWIVVEGTAKVTINEKITFISAGESIYVPKESVHRMENEESFPMILIEVQIGSYLGEDDIIRYEDRYSRGNS